MLSITRTRGQKVIIPLGDGRTITITASRRVRLRIEAPADIPILRDELLERAKERAA